MEKIQRKSQSTIDIQRKNSTIHDQLATTESDNRKSIQPTYLLSARGCQATMSTTMADNIQHSTTIGNQKLRIPKSKDRKIYNRKRKGIGQNGVPLFPATMQQKLQQQFRNSALAPELSASIRRRRRATTNCRHRSTKPFGSYRFGTIPILLPLINDDYRRLCYRISTAS